MSRYVLDAFSLLALIQDEPGASKVQEILDGASKGKHELYISVINLGEIIYTLWGRRGISAAEQALAGLNQLPITSIDVDRTLVFRAAALKGSYRLHYADCFVGALAQQTGATVLTGDPHFRQVEQFIPVEWLPSPE
ncbi:MAG: type II toxin-antitoxin system VapC family toxin [Dehalococcoidia bacterium]|nr:type II toxin-antitoxin system VapC family toxin [Dehalococcoidia bacterium]